MPLYSGGNVLNERLPWVTGPIVDTAGKLDGLVFLLLEVIVSHWQPIAEIHQVFRYSNSLEKFTLINVRRIWK